MKQNVIFEFIFREYFKNNFASVVLLNNNSLMYSGGSDIEGKLILPLLQQRLNLFLLSNRNHHNADKLDSLILT